MKYFTICIFMIFFCHSIIDASERGITLYINNKPADCEIILLNGDNPMVPGEILASSFRFVLKYESHSDILYIGDKIFSGEKIVKNNSVFISIKDFAESSGLNYSYDAKAGTVDLRGFPVRLQNEPKNISSIKEENPQKTGEEVKILYERTESKSDNSFVVYATVQNVSSSILDRVVIKCIFTLPNGRIVDQKSFDLNSLYPGNYREITFSTPKPTADGLTEGFSLSRTTVTTPDGNNYSSTGFPGGTPAAPQLLTPDYRLFVDYQIRMENKK